MSTHQPESLLTDDCGHHCGVEMVGTTQRVAHCTCGECHHTAVSGGPR